MTLRAEVDRISASLARALAQVGPQPWATQTVWHVDFDNGDDQASGLTQETAIKTFAQLIYRLSWRGQGQPHRWAPTNDVDIYLYGDNKQSDPLTILDWYIASPDPGVVLRQVRFHAMTPRIYYSGSFSAVQVLNRATNTPWVVTDANNIGSNQTPPVTGPNANARWYNPILNPFGGARSTDFQRMRIVGGPRDGAMAWTMNANGASFNRPWATNGNMRTSQWAKPVPFGVQQGFIFGFTYMTPQSGDVYVIEQLQKIYVSTLRIGGNNDSGGSGVSFDGFFFAPMHGYDSQQMNAFPEITSDGGSIVFVNSYFDWAVAYRSAASFTGNAFVYFLNCAGIDGFTAWGGVGNYIEAGVSHLSVSALGVGTTVWVDGDKQIITGAAIAASGGTVVLSSCGIWDMPGHNYKGGAVAGWGLGQGGIIHLPAAGAYGILALYGVDDAGATRKYGVGIQDGGKFIVHPNARAGVTITGVVGNLSIGLSDTRGNVASTMNYATDPPSITTKRSLVTTWANIFTGSIAAGFWGGRIVDMETSAVLQPPTSET